MKASLLIILFSFLSLFDAKDIKGKVIKVIDGDTIIVLVENEQIKVRLDGIDCPEKKQDYGEKARKFTENLCAGKTVKIISSGKDRYRRVLGSVLVGKVNVNKELLKAGLAWHYKHFNKDKELSALEFAAKEKKIGLWYHKNPIPPWDFRKK